MQKVILTDCDGVLLDWVEGFQRFMNEQGYEQKLSADFAYHFEDEYGITRSEMTNKIREFNESEGMKTLKPIKNAELWIPRFEKLGYKFHVITSMTDDEQAQHWRMENLVKVFGNVFTCFTFLDTGDDKDDILKQAKSISPTAEYWIEDKPANVEAGVRAGFKSILIDHVYNQESNGGGLRLGDWEDIYHEITGDMRQV